MGLVGSQIVLVNRVGEPLKFVADGVHYELAPGDNYGYVEPHAFFAMKQNPLMGSEDYYTQEFRSLVGVRGREDCPCDPISDEDLLAAMDCLERFNRSTADLAPVNFVKPRHRMPRGRTGEITTVANDRSMALGG